ncbi:hypothetical protein FACS1894199_11130 [Bacteroidia bacterium]|nr:hypothetical protein FACS1894199_11130 [Bacteroidia bacterium]
MRSTLNQNVMKLHRFLCSTFVRQAVVYLLFLLSTHVLTAQDSIPIASLSIENLNILVGDHSAHISVGIANDTLQMKIIFDSITPSYSNCLNKILYFSIPLNILPNIPIPTQTVAGDILINEIMYNAVPTAAEYIELYNHSDKQILLNTILIAKRSATSGAITSKRRTTDSAIALEPGALVWICSEPESITPIYTHHNLGNCLVVASSLSYNNDGGVVVVLNEQNIILDEFAFNNSFHTTTVTNKKGIALERIDRDLPTSDLAAWASAGGDGSDGYGSPGMPNRQADTILIPEIPEMPLLIEVGDILINEIMYNAVPTAAEYLELYNNSDKQILLNTVQIAKRNATSGAITNKRRITDSAFVFEPGALVWICKNSEEITSNYACHNLENCFISSSTLSYNNDGGVVAVLNEQDTLIDEFAFNNSYHNSVITNKKGISLERINYHLPTSELAAWTSGGGDGSDGYGSPGMSNRSASSSEPSISPSNESLSLRRDPEVFTPNGDGYEDEVNIYIGTANGEIDFTATINIYDASGRLVLRLLDGVPVHSEIRTVWNGNDASGKLMPAGIYVLLAEIMTTKGQKKTLRKVCVLSR